MIQGDRIAPGWVRLPSAITAAVRIFTSSRSTVSPRRAFRTTTRARRSLSRSHFSGTGIEPATDLDTVRDLRYGAMEARDRLAENAPRERFRRSAMAALRRTPSLRRGPVTISIRS